MKINHLAKMAFVAIAAIAITPNVSSGQTAFIQSQDTVVAVVADAQGLQRVPAEELPFFGTFWVVRNTVPCVLAPMPCPPLDPSLAVYAIADGQFLVDESAGQMMVSQRQLSTASYASLVQEQVDELANFIAWIQQVQLSKESSLTMSTMDSGGPPTPGEGGEGGTNDWGGFEAMTYTTNDLWLELIAKTNSTGYFVIHPPWTELANGVYDIFETTNLSTSVPGLNGTNWLWVYRTDPGQTNFVISDLTDEIAFFRAAKTNDTDGDSMSDAYERLVSHTDPNTPDGPLIVFQPISQTVEQGDTVTFSVVAQGPSPLRYQWVLGGTNISGATNSSFSIVITQPSDAGDYSVEVTSPALLSVQSSNATLTVQSPVNWPLVTLAGPRQDYVFKNGVSYYVPTRVELYGTTVIEGGATIKVDWYYPDSTLAVMGTLVCKTDDPYFPAFLTSVDDDTVGDALDFSSGAPTAVSNGVPYLDLAYAQDTTPALNNLRIRYADQAVATPASKRLDVWNCQFNRCNSSFIANQGATVSLHNVLLGSCATAVVGITNFTAIEAEHVTAEATNLWSQYPPTRISLTNSIIVGTIASGPTLVTDHAAINPASPVFQQAGSGHYYLTNSSPYRHAGTANISPRLATEFRQKTTQPPLVFADMIDFNGELTLNPQASRYTNGAPDYGYYYAALDYTVGWITNWGRITILPGTAIGFRNEYSSAHNRYTWWGFDLREGSTFISHGTPTRPNVFADVQLVQEQLAGACVGFFVPNYWPSYEGKPGPSLDFRFSNFYANSHWYHVWAGYDASYEYLYSSDSRVNWKLRDCNLHGGRITLGQPDDGSWYGAPPDWVYGPCTVSWVNNLFDNVAIDLDPTFYQFGYGLNCDMAFSAYNNLFRGGLWFHLQPIPASAGDWVLKDNLFDKVDFIQDTNAPLDFSYNGYWPATVSELSWLYNYYPWFQPNSGQLLVATNGGGGNEQVLATTPPYQSGPFGNHYLPTTTALYHAGSRTADDAAFHQYTTRTDQIKEGDEFPTGHNVSIGLHFVATTNASGIVPKDSDNDGIPDFIEDANGNGTVDSDETSPLLVETVTGITDSTNSVYDDIDLSGNGLVGRVKKVLGLSPFQTSNPLQLIQTFTGEEPDIATFDVPTAYALVTNGGALHLSLNGVDATADSCIAATNGSCRLQWETTFDKPIQHYAQARIKLSGYGADVTVLSGAGPLVTLYSSNVLQFAEAGSMFDDNGAYLDAQLPCPDSIYTIDLYDPSTTPATLIKSITNSTSTGLIREDWDLTDSTGTNHFTGDTVEAVFNVILLDPGTNTHKRILHKATGSLTESGPNIDVVYMYTPRNGSLASAFAKNGIFWTSMQGVVDALIKPAWPYEVYQSYFNRYLPDPSGEYPGYIQRRTRTTNDSPNLPSITQTLFPDMTNGVTKQFYCYSHGSSDKMFNASEDVYFKADEVGNLLGNIYRSRGGLTTKNPYRFVFLDGCSTASTEWRRAFGIFPIDTADQAARNKVGPQALVGYANTIISYPTVNADCAEAYAQTVLKFYTFWMNKQPLAECIRICADGNSNAAPFPVPGNELFVVKGVIYDNKPGLNADIYVMGHSGLTVDGLNSSFDGKYKPK
jgi:plastocyanin